MHHAELHDSLVTPADYARARRLLMRRDPVLGAAIKRIGPCGMAARQRKRSSDGARRRDRQSAAVHQGRGDDFRARPGARSRTASR